MMSVKWTNQLGLKPRLSVFWTKKNGIIIDLVRFEGCFGY